MPTLKTGVYPKTWPSTKRSDYVDNQRAYPKLPEDLLMNALTRKLFSDGDRRKSNCVIRGYANYRVVEIRSKTLWVWKFLGVLRLTSVNL